jgi:hypothetical protein
MSSDESPSNKVCFKDTHLTQLKNSEFTTMHSNTQKTMMSSNLINQSEDDDLFTTLARPTNNDFNTRSTYTNIANE